MILTDVQIEGFRRFASPVRLDGLGPGLNVLAAPNEAGKSTLLTALKAVLMVRSSSKAKPVKDLQPYGGGAPHVALSFTWKGMECHLEKQFLSKAFTRLILGPERFEGDQAEEALRALLGLEEASKGEAAGLWSVLLVGQGESFVQPDLNQTGQDSLRGCLEQGVEQATGGAAASAVLSRVRERLYLLQTAKSAQPTGKYKHALEQEAQARASLRELENRRAALEEDLVALDQARRALREQEDPDRKAQDEAELLALRQQRDTMRIADAEEQAARAALATATQTLNSIRDEQERRRERQAAHRRLEREAAEMQHDLQALTQRTAQARQRYEASRTRREQAEQQQQAARQALLTISRRAAVLQQQGALEREKQILERAEAACTRLEQARAALAALRVDEAVIRRVRKAVREMDAAQAALNARATRLTVTLLPEASGRVLLDGAACPQGDMVLTQAAELRIEGIGQVRITPAVKDQEEAQAAADAARHQLQSVMQATGCQTVEEAERLFEERRQAETRVAEARAAFVASLPAARDDRDAALFEALAAMRQDMRDRMASLARELEACTPDGRPEQADQTDAALQQMQTTARQEEDSAARAADEARQAERAEHVSLSAAQGLQDKAEAALRQKLAEREQIGRELAVRAAQESDDALAERAAVAVQAQAQAEAHSQTLRAGREAEQPLSVVEARIARREQALDSGRASVVRLREEIRERETRVRVAEGDGLDEKIAEAGRAADRLRLECEGYERERAALALLDQTLSDAEKTQTERYLAPLVRTMQPAFSAVFPGASLEMDTGFALSGLTRRTAEEFGRLSDGTREQIAVLVRLGFAELLHARQSPAILVLDDALSFSDSQRLESMFDVLADAATRFQILVLTCHAEAFARLGGRALALRPIPQITERR
ncbi:GTP-binding protein [Acetobacter persici]|uniref:ATP-binding protein n=1 Tax=Acetobacter persici TaxID=1076596 RepID=UPI001BA8F619|nr:ATP-binding protein [Acetobacter persici]MBS1000939.1 GTP-binding protein [Acetobacter persici]